MIISLQWYAVTLMHLRKFIYVYSIGAMHSNLAQKEQGTLKIVTYNILGKWVYYKCNECTYLMN